MDKTTDTAKRIYFLLNKYPDFERRILEDEQDI